MIHLTHIPPILCDYCESSNHTICNYPYRDYVDAACVNIEKTLNELTDKMIETMKERIVEYLQCVNRSRENYSEPDYSLGSPKPEHH